MSYLSLSTIRKKVSCMSKAISAPKGSGPVFGQSSDFGYPRIAVYDNGYHFIIEERGQELERRTTRDIDELLYWIFNSITFNMACSYELSHRVPGEDSRRLLFRRQVELLDSLSPAFSARKRAEIESILKEYPYEDEIEPVTGNIVKMRPAKRPRRSLRLDMATDVRFLWSDVWLLQAIYYASRVEPARLSLVIGAADFINHAIMMYEELSGGLARLDREGLVVVDTGRWELSCSEMALAYIRSREQLRHVHDLGREIERWLEAAPYARKKPAHSPSDDLHYPGLSKETFDAAVDEYLKGLKKRL